jgi:hypothetical protein
MSSRGDDVAYAANWKTVLAADGAVGLLPVVVGAILVAGGSWLWGPLLIAGGAAYVVLVARRASRWRRLRRDAGLSPRRPPG